MGHLSVVGGEVAGKADGLFRQTRPKLSIATTVPRTAREFVPIMRMPLLIGMFLTLSLSLSHNNQGAAACPMESEER